MQQIVESIVYKDIIEEQERQKAAEQAKEVDSIYLTKEGLDKITDKYRYFDLFRNQYRKALWNKEDPGFITSI